MPSMTFLYLFFCSACPIQHSSANMPRSIPLDLPIDRNGIKKHLSFGSDISCSVKSVCSTIMTGFPVVGSLSALPVSSSPVQSICFPSQRIVTGKSSSSFCFCLWIYFHKERKNNQPKSPVPRRKYSLCCPLLPINRPRNRSIPSSTNALPYKNKSAGRYSRRFNG